MIASLKYRLHRLQYQERYRYLDELLDNQQLSHQQLLHKQQRELEQIIRFAATEVPFYTEKYAGLISPGEALPSIQSLPVLSKDDVLQHRDSMLVTGHDPAQLRIGSTGGSTGKPLSFYYDRHKMELMRAGMCRSYMWSGWRPGEKILNFWGARQDLKTDSGLGRQLGKFIAAETTIPAYQFSEAQLADWVASINSYRPVLLQGYASILAKLAGYIVDQELTISARLKGVYSTAEVLYDWQRQVIEQAFGCKVFNQYGSREVPNMAVECRHGNQHVFSDMVYMESVEQNGAQVLLVTSLTNQLMPFIRYRIGDAGMLKTGECGCGSPFPMMEMGLCRSNDIIRTPSGKQVYPAYFIHLLDGLSDIRQYQFVQNAPDNMQLFLAGSAPLSAASQQQLQQKVASEVDRKMQLEIIHCEAIPSTISGKHRFVISYATNE